ncbi:MAG: hypothetical protein JXN64_06225 [Spirochaetes bacterium]|nr:hypothetical protein [Spirochaetota bacterium]
MKKNVASQRIYVFAFNYSTGAPVTGDAAQITMEISKDNGAFAAITDTNPTELAHGRYYFDVTQTESNADIIVCDSVSSTSNVVVLVEGGNTIVTVPSYFADLGIASDGDLNKVNTLDGHTAQTGDSYAIVNNGTYGLSAIETLVDEIESRLTAARAGYLDLLNTYLDMAISTVDGHVSDTFDDVGDVKTVVDYILADTSELQADWHDGGRLDLLIDAIKVVTDSLATMYEDVTGYRWTAHALGVLNNISVAQVNVECDTAISDAGLLTAVSNIATILGRIIGTLASGTHNPQSGDAYTRLGANGAGLTALGDTRLTNLDATVSSRSSHTAADVITALWLKVVDGTKTFGKMIKTLNAFVRGNSTRTLEGTTVTQTFAKEDGTTPQLTGTIEEDGTRTTTVEAD